jgi:hypothetical protein
MQSVRALPWSFTQTYIEDCIPFKKLAAYFVLTFPCEK